MVGRGRARLRQRRAEPLRLRRLDHRRRDPLRPRLEPAIAVHAQAVREPDRRGSTSRVSGLCSGQIGSTTTAGSGRALARRDLGDAGSARTRRSPNFVRTARDRARRPGRLDSTRSARRRRDAHPRRPAAALARLRPLRDRLRAAAASTTATSTYWIAELVLEGRLASPELAPFYLGAARERPRHLRRRRGLPARHPLPAGRSATTCARSRPTRSCSAGASRAGRRCAPSTPLQRSTLVRGAPTALRDAADDADYFGVELGVAF